MEKRISYTDFQAIKSVAKAIDPKVRECESIKKKITKLADDYKAVADQINLLEAGIFKTLGFHVTDLVVKVIEPDAKGNKITKYRPTSMVTYDSQKKQYVINVPNEPAVNGNNYDIDKENAENKDEALFN